MDNLKDIKVGDKVIMGGGYSNKHDIRIVSRIGATFIEIGDNKYCNINGKLKGEKNNNKYFNHSYIRRKATEQDINLYEKHDILKLIISYISNKKDIIIENIDYSDLKIFNDAIQKAISKGESK